MIPYFELRQIPIAAGHSLAVFGTLVTIGIVVGAWFSERRARALGIPLNEIYGAVASALFPGLVLAHAVALIPYADADATWSPRIVFQFWNGMSSFGGFAGAFLGLTLYYRRARRSWLPTADTLMQGLVIGWVFGRLGCTLVHDHIGRPSSSLLAIQFAGGGRHDLGLYELLYTIFVLLPAVIVLNRRPRPAGTSVAVLALLYAPARFLGDFLRHVDLGGADVRYAGLTLAQYACILLTGIGVVLAMRLGTRDQNRGTLATFLWTCCRWLAGHHTVPPRPCLRTSAQLHSAPIDWTSRPHVSGRETSQSHSSHAHSQSCPT